MLTTLNTPITLSIESRQLAFWFRDLPLKQDAGKLVFDRSGGLETNLGPDPAAINRNRLVKTLYEWRLFAPPETGGRGRFEFDLAGPLVARPLRLVALEIAFDGMALRLEILMTIQLRGPAAENDKSPFEAEQAYASGNLAILTFTPAPGHDELKLTKFTRVKLGTPGDPFPASNDTLVLMATARVPAKNDPSTCLPSATRVQLQLMLRVLTNGEVDIASANLRTRLFGQDCNLDTRDAHFATGKLLASFTPPPSDGVLRLKKLTLSWAIGKDPIITLEEGGLYAPLRAGDANSPFAFVRNFAGADRVRWLGISTTAVSEEVDHDSGVVKINIVESEIAADSLFRGFLLPVGRLRGAIAIVFRRTESENDTWPRAVLGSAFAEFAFDATEDVALRRVKAIRHRHVGIGASDGPKWTSHFLFDAAFATTGPDKSSITWPVGNAGVSDSGFNPDPGKKNEWTKTLTMKTEDALVLEHRVSPRVCAHELPVDRLLVLENEQLVLDEPWRFRAVVEHSFMPAKDKKWPGVIDANDARAELKWTSIDEICLVNMERLVQAAKLDQKQPALDEPYAFLARYKGTQNEIRIAGVVRRSLADAGFPVRHILQAIHTAVDPPSLVLAGAAVIEVVTSPPLAGGGPIHDRSGLGVTLVPQWILPWAVTNAPGASPPYPALGDLKDIPQIELDLAQLQDRHLRRRSQYTARIERCPSQYVRGARRNSKSDRRPTCGRSRSGIQ